MSTNAWRSGARAIAAFAALFLVMGLAPDATIAQRHGGHTHDEERYAEAHYDDDRGTRWELGGGLAVMSPRGQFGTFIDDGFGVALNATMGLESSNVLGLRFEVGYINYGSERLGVPVFPSGGRIFTDLVTRNNIGFAGLGPQLQIPLGRVRPYVNGFVGVGYFFTESSIRGGYAYDYGGYGSTLNFDDASLAYGAGGGLGIRVNRGRTPIFLKLDAQYRRHGQTEYLVPGSIIDDGFGGAFIDPLFTDVDFMVFQVGLSVGL